MSPIGNLFAERPPSKKWAALYLLATAAGFLLTSYAADVADKLAPARPILVEGSMTAPIDESGDVGNGSTGVDVPAPSEYVDIETLPADERAALRAALYD